MNILKRLVILVIAFASFSGINAYKFTIHNTTNSDVDLTFNLNKKGLADEDVQNWDFTVISPAGDVAVGLAAYCDFTYPKKITVKANATGVLDTAYCCISDIQIPDGTPEGGDFSLSATCNDNTLYIIDKPAICGVNALGVQRTRCLSTKSSPTDFATLAKAGKQLIDQEAKSGNITLTFIPSRKLTGRELTEACSSVQGINYRVTQKKGPLEKALLNQLGAEDYKSSYPNGLPDAYVPFFVAGYPVFENIPDNEYKELNNALSVQGTCNTNLVNVVDAKDPNGDTPLHIAIRKNSRGWARYLISWGANILAKNKNGETPFHLAFKIGNPDPYITKLLLKALSLRNEMNPSGQSTALKVLSEKDSSGFSVKDYLDKSAEKTFKMMSDALKKMQTTPAEISKTINEKISKAMEDSLKSGKK